MKLYYAPGACSLADHIALIEAGMDFSAIAVNLKTHVYGDGKDFLKINPKGYVPALQLNDGKVLTENAVILQYIGDQKPASKLLPTEGHFERYRCLEWVVYISTELHKNFGMLFSEQTPAVFKETVKQNIAKRFAFVNDSLGDKPFLLGQDFTIADAYLFTIGSWAPKFNIDLKQWPALAKYEQRLRARLSVQAALKQEGLV